MNLIWNFEEYFGEHVRKFCLSVYVANDLNILNLA